MQFEDWHTDAKARVQWRCAGTAELQDADDERRSNRVIAVRCLQIMLGVRKGPRGAGGSKVRQKCARTERQVTSAKQRQQSHVNPTDCPIPALMPGAASDGPFSNERH